MSGTTIVSSKPLRKFPKAASTITEEAVQKDIQGLVVEMKKMLGADLIKQREAV